MLQEITITIKVPVLNPGVAAQAVGGVQQILNDFDRLNDEALLLNQTFAINHETQARITRFQQENGIAPATGGVGVRTWTALLQMWLPTEEAG